MITPLARDLLAASLAVLPSMSLFPFAPFADTRGRPIDSFSPALSPSRVCPSMSRLPSSLHSQAQDKLTALPDRRLIRSLSAFSLTKEDQVNENA